MFSCDICEIFKSTFFNRKHLVIAPRLPAETHFILEHISFSLYLFSLKRLVSHENAKMHHHLKVGLSLDTVINADTPAP